MPPYGSADGGQREGLRHKWSRWLQAATDSFRRTCQSRAASRLLAQQASPMRVPSGASAYLRHEWKKLLASSGRTQEAEASPGELAALRRIMDKTAAANRNNLTRTAAYLKLYTACPELHWAFLAHMVSRNGGYGMTDLKGEWLVKLLAEQERQDIFLFLERSNALIFQDAYPQLCLYRESLEAGRPLFHLLPRLHVSAFMRPVWERFWLDRNPVPLTVCLIVNEQNYIEDRVVQNGFYRKRVLEQPAFKAQSLLQLNQVLLPYGTGGGLPAGRSGAPGASALHAPAASLSPVHGLAGLILEDFSDLKERIGVGKALYAMLFGIPAVRGGAEAFASSRPHTGSRTDYAPALFTPIQKASPHKAYAGKLDKAGLAPGAEPIYSPSLTDVWADHPIDAIERFDWFRDGKAAKALTDAIAPGKVDISGEVWTGLCKLELAVLAAEAAGLEQH